MTELANNIKVIAFDIFGTVVDWTDELEASGRAFHIIVRSEEPTGWRMAVLKVVSQRWAGRGATLAGRSRHYTIARARDFHCRRWEQRDRPRWDVGEHFADQTGRVDRRSPSQVAVEVVGHGPRVAIPV